MKHHVQYSWHVLHDVPGLIAAMGGRDRVEKNLDGLFSAPDKDGFKSCDITGLIGQYVHGNEPSHHIIYFYPQIGRSENLGGECPHEWAVNDESVRGSCPVPSSLGVCPRRRAKVATPNKGWCC